MIKCQRCGAPNAIGNRFCGNCGAPLAATGPTRQLGTAEGPGAVPSQLAGELRWVSVLFVDLVDYTALTHAWDAGDVRDMLAGYFDLARGIIGRYGGEVAKFIGDAVVAVWGSRTIREDDAERSVRAGLEVVDAVTRFGIDQGWSHLMARGGVVTGRAALLTGADEGLVAGDIVNLASRIQSVAEPGSVFVDAVTRRATGGAVMYASTGDHQLKGLPRRMQLWRADRIVGSARDGQRQDGLTASFVGRDRELGTLKSLLEETSESRRARLLVLAGQAGIGKSRLASEFRIQLAGRVPSVGWHRGRCPSYGDGLPFWALSEMLRHLLGLDEHETGAVARARLAERLSRWVSDEERGFVEPRLGVLLDAADRDFTRQELFAAWRLFFERLSDVQPQVLLFEDLQWAGRELWEFVNYLLDWSAERPLFLLAATRFDENQAQSTPLVGRSRTDHIDLEPLPADAIQDIIDGLVSGLPDALKQRVAADSAGVPLYAVEMVRSLVDRGLVVFQGGGGRVLVGEVGDLEVPASLTALVAARLDQLTPEERNLVKGLAVLGLSFTRLAIGAVANAPDAEVDELLQTLVNKGILATVSEAGSQGGGLVYQFVQSMVGTVAGDLLSRRERKVRHLAVADWLERMALHQAPDLVELVAAHYHDAYRASLHDSDRTAIRRRAALAYERAASRVFSLGSADRAARYYETAAGLAEDETFHVRLIEAAARASFVSGQYERSLELYERALEAHRAAKRDVAAARLAPALARTLSVLGRTGDGLSVLQAGIEVLAENQEVEPLAEAHAVLAERFAFALDDKEVARHAERAVELAAHSSEVLCKALSAKGWLLQRQHHASEAAATFAELVEVARTHDLPLAELTGRGNLADVQSQADLPGAESGHLAALELAERLGDIGNRAVSLSNIALHYFFAGQWERTESYARRALESVDILELQNFGHFPLLVLAVARGDSETARTHLPPLQSWADDDDAQSRDSYLIAEAALASVTGQEEEWLILAGKAARSAYEANGLMSESFRLAWPLALQAAVHAGDHDQARALLAMVANAPPHHVPAYLDAQRSRYAALITIAGGGGDADVEAEFRSAIDTLRDLGYPYWLARTEADLARWLESQQRKDEAMPLRAEARDVLARLGAPVG